MEELCGLFKHLVLAQPSFTYPLTRVTEALQTPLQYQIDTFVERRFVKKSGSPML